MIHFFELCGGDGFPAWEKWTPLTNDALIETSALTTGSVGVLSLWKSTKIEPLGSSENMYSVCIVFLKSYITYNSMFASLWNSFPFHMRKLHECSKTVPFSNHMTVKLTPAVSRRR